MAGLVTGGGGKGVRIYRHEPPFPPEVGVILLPNLRREPDSQCTSHEKAWQLTLDSW